MTCYGFYGEKIEQHMKHGTKMITSCSIRRVGLPTFQYVQTIGFTNDFVFLQVFEQIETSVGKLTSKVILFDPPPRRLPGISFDKSAKSIIFFVGRLSDASTNPTDGSK